MRICVVGLGKIGLPLAVQYASKGHVVIGADISDRTVDLVNRGLEPFPGETDLCEKLERVVREGKLSATSSTEQAVSASDVIVVVVPLFVDARAEPDFGPLDQATSAIGRSIRKGSVVIYETTLPVGTTRSRFAPALETESNLKAETDFSLVFSPERVLTGRVFADLRRYPKLVGGVGPLSEDAGVDFYEAVLDFEDRQDLSRPNGVWRMGSSEAAELAKLAETTYRDVNIGLANQFAKFADKANVDILKVIDACNSQPFSHIHTPGVSVGGHCIPVYPRLYLYNDPDASIVASARQANLSMPKYAVHLLREGLGELSGKTVAVFGAAYRGQVKETAFSGVFDLVEELQRHGATVVVDDPLYTDEELMVLGLPPMGEDTRIDGLIIHTDHLEYKSLESSQFPDTKCVIDGRYILESQRWSGVSFFQIGRGTR